MLIGNGLLTSKTINSYIGGNINSFSWNGDDEQLIIGDNKASIPEGYGNKAFRMPRKTGSLVGRDYFEFIQSTPMLISGQNIDGNTSFEFEQLGDITKLVNISGNESFEFEQDGSLSKIVNMNGDSTFEFTQTATLVTPVVNMSGSISFEFGQAGNMSVAISLNGSTDFDFSSVANMKVIRNIGGTTEDTSGLTPASIWSYGDRTLTGSGGLSIDQQNQLNAIEANTGNIAALM